MNDNELLFLQHLQTNEALLEYYHHVQEGLCSLFIQSKIVDGKFKVDGSTNTTTALQLAGELIPEVGGVMVTLGAVMEISNEKEIKTKL